MLYMQQMCGAVRVGAWKPPLRRCITSLLGGVDGPYIAASAHSAQWLVAAALPRCRQRLVTRWRKPSGVLHPMPVYRRRIDNVPRETGFRRHCCPMADCTDHCRCIRLFSLSRKYNSAYGPVTILSRTFGRRSYRR